MLFTSKKQNLINLSETHFWQWQQLRCQLTLVCWRFVSILSRVEGVYCVKISRSPPRSPDGLYIDKQPESLNVVSSLCKGALFKMTIEDHITLGVVLSPKFSGGFYFKMASFVQNFWIISGSGYCWILEGGTIIKNCLGRSIIVSEQGLNPFS